MSVFEGDEKSEMVDVAEASVPDNYVPPCGMEGKPPVVETLLLYSKNCSSHFEGSVINLIKKGYGAYLCANERFAVIKCLSNGVFTLSYKEDAIIDLIIGTPSVHAAELLQYLKQDNSGLIRKIEDGFQFENYVSVFKAIQQLYLKGTTQTTISAEVEKINSTFLSDKTREEKAQQQYFTWFEGGILKAMFADNFIFSRFDNVVIADDGTVTFQYATDPNQHGESTTQISIKPFALVGIRIRGNTNEVLEAGNGSMVYVPGITLPLLISKKETAELFDALNSTAVVTGVGTVITGTTRFVIVSGGIDILLGSSALIVDSYKDDILKMSYGPDFLDAYVLVNKAFLVYFGARTSVHLAQATLALPKLQSSFSIFRNSDDFAKLKVTNSSKAAQIENEVEQLLKKGEEIAKGGAKTLATSGDELLALGRNIFKGSDEMLQAAKTKIADFRIAMKGKKKLGGNLGYVEGDLNGVKLDDELVSSTANFDNPDIFNAKFVNNQNQIRPDAIDGAYLRTGDSEFQMLSNVAQKFNLQKGQVYNYTGTIKVVSELPFCASCSGVIHQFSEMLPNVKIIIVNGAK